jgi:hypothetical protein
MSQIRHNKNAADIVFYVPYYHKHSNGIVMLWNIAYQFSLLKKSNIFVYEMPWGERNFPPHKFLRLLIDKKEFEALENPIVIYPDIETKNPLNAKRVVRYLLAKPLSLGNKFLPGPEDYIVSYSKLISDKKILDEFYFLGDELDVVNKVKLKSKKSLISIYYGKCLVEKQQPYIKKIISKFDSIEVITRTSPDNKEELYDLLSKSKLLISFDPFSHLTLIANILGTPVLFANDIFIRVFSNFNQKIYGYYYKKDFGDLDQITSPKNCKRIRDETIKEILRIKSNENKNIKKFHNSILNHFNLIHNLAYKKENLEKITQVKKEFLDFAYKVWRKKRLFVVMGESLIAPYIILCNGGYKGWSLRIILGLKNIIFAILKVILPNFLIRSSFFVKIRKIFLNQVIKRLI